MDKNFLKIMLTLCFAYLFSVCVYADDDYIIKMKDGGLSAYSLEENDMGYICDDLYTADKETAESLLKSGAAEYIEPNYPLEMYDVDNEDTAVYNDGYFYQQIYMDTMHIPALQRNHSGKIRVAVIDSGINTAHPDLVGADIETGHNYVDDNDDTADLYNHGTRVAGIIAAQPDNGIGLAGICPQCTIVPIVTMTKKNVDGQSVTVGNLEHMIKAINGAVNDYDCKILNMSLGVAGYSKSLEETVDNAVAKGVIIIAAAGNDGTKKEGAYNYPASFDNVISVGAVTENLSIADYSQRNDMVDVSAVLRTMSLPSNNGGYISSRGTSFAAPVITGMTALFISDHPDMDIYGFKNVIMAATADVCESGKDYSGYGVLIGDEMDKLITYAHTIFISPYFQGQTAKLKLLTSERAGGEVLIKALYEDGLQKRFETEELSFDEEGIAYITEYIGENEKLQLFVWDSLEGQQCLSTVR